MAFSLPIDFQNLNPDSSLRNLSPLPDDPRNAPPTAPTSIDQIVMQLLGMMKERNQALIELYQQPLMAGIKQIFAGATSDRDIATFIAGLPSLDKNPDAAIQVALERAAQLDNQIQKDNLTRDIVENEFGYSEPYNSLAVQNRVKERFKPATANTGVVTMAAPDGSTRSVPAAQVEYWKSKGAKVVDEQK